MTVSIGSEWMPSLNPKPKVKWWLYEERRTIQKNKGKID
jgi:hypothetical protein